MSLDRFIYFDNGPAPNKDEIGNALRNYLCGFTANRGYPTWVRDRWCAYLIGVDSYALKDQESMRGTAAHAFWNSPESERPRYLEVYIGSDNIDVITRQSDEATNALAEGFADLVARFWEGRREE